jgi:hypothetical protein
MINRPRVQRVGLNAVKSQTACVCRAVSYHCQDLEIAAAIRVALHVDLEHAIEQLLQLHQLTCSKSVPGE